MSAVQRGEVQRCRPWVDDATVAEATAPTASWWVEDWWGTAAVSTADAPRGCISATAAVRTAI